MYQLNSKSIPIFNFLDQAIIDLFIYTIFSPLSPPWNISTKVCLIQKIHSQFLSSYKVAKDNRCIVNRALVTDIFHKYASPCTYFILIRHAD